MKLSYCLFILTNTNEPMVGLISECHKKNAEQKKYAIHRVDVLEQKVSSTDFSLR